jgi:uncharacterized repeat protein (TIGR01451 family)
VQFVAPAGRTFITKDSGADDKDSDAGTDGKTGTYTLTVAEPNITTVDAGLQKPIVPVGSIGDFVFEDTDNSGTQTAGDLPVKDVVVNLLNAAGTVIATTTTGADGKYLFSNLPLGTYSVQFVAPAGRTFITKDSGADDKDSDAGTDGKTGTYTLTVAEPNITTVDAGLQPVKEICVKPTFKISSSPKCSPDNSEYTFTFSTAIGASISVDFGTVSGTNPYTVKVPAGRNVKITATKTATCKNDTTITAPASCGCSETPPIVLGATVSVCKGDTFPTLKATLIGSGFIDWYSTATGGTPVKTNSLTYKPTGVATVSETFFLVAKPLISVCPTIAERTPVVVLVQNCDKLIDLHLTKKIDKKLRAIGEDVVYTIKVWNESKNPATGVEVTDVLNAGIAYKSSVTSRGSYDPATKKWTIGNIAANGDTVTLTITAKVLDEGVWFNTAEISKANEKDIDSTPGNDNATEDDIDRACFSVPLKLCTGQAIEATVPAEYSDVKWFKGSTQIGTGTTIKLTTAGIYTFTAANGSCPVGGCCPVIIEETTCCPPELCVPFTITKKRK